MTSSEKSIGQGDSSLQIPSAARHAATNYANDFSAERIKEAILQSRELTSPLEELIATGEAVFEFIRQSEMDLSTKNAFYRLEIQFDFYKNLLSN